MFGNIIGTVMIGLFFLCVSIGGCSSSEISLANEVATTTVNDTETDLSKAQRYAIRKDKMDFVRNTRAVGGAGHIMYEIERGTVTCIEHEKRAELACWRNGNHATADVQNRTSYQ